jgi:NitT/TauT family transport system ATP-binding protein
MPSSPNPEPLPHAPIGMVLGLLDHLREVPNGREDLYKLGGPLGYELDDLLPVTEAAKRLGFVRIASGDIELTEAGQTLAAAEEPERKRRIRDRILKLPLVAEIHAAVDRSGGRVARKEFLERLTEHFSPGEADRQIATALDWARYGEVFDFDPDTEEFFLPPAE